VGSSDLRTVRAFDPATGATRWETDVYGWTWGTPAAVNGTIYAASASGTPYIQAVGSGIGALDAATGAWRWRITESAPANAPFPIGYASGPVQLTAGAIVIAGLDGRLRAFPA
jgi:outer membrane protein assembly factor BamB